jgi:hypothetical protein
LPPSACRLPLGTDYWDVRPVLGEQRNSVDDGYQLTATRITEAGAASYSGFRPWWGGASVPLQSLAPVQRGANAQFRRATDPQFVPSHSVSDALARPAPSLRKSSSLSSCVSRSGRGSCWSHRYNSRSSSAIASRIAARSSLLLGVGLRTMSPGFYGDLVLCCVRHAN